MDPILTYGIECKEITILSHNPELSGHFVDNLPLWNNSWIIAFGQAAFVFHLSFLISSSNMYALQRYAFSFTFASSYH